MATRESDLQLASAPELENFRRRFIGGVGLYWEDFRIYSHNQLVTKTVKQYEQLYPLLDSKEIDYFTLGLNEIFVEKEIYSKQFPNLVINSDIAFFYPYPFYYFVHPSRSELAKRIDVGLNKALTDGSFRRIFDRHYHDEAQRLKELNLKKIYYLDNPTLVTLPTMKFQWWLESPPRLR